MESLYVEAFSTSKPKPTQVSPLEPIKPTPQEQDAQEGIPQYLYKLKQMIHDMHLDYEIYSCYINQLDMAFQNDTFNATIPILNEIEALLDIDLFLAHK